MRRLVLPAVFLADLLMVWLLRGWDYFPFAATFGLSLLLTMVFSPLVQALAIRMGAMDKPNPRKVHKTPTPLWGGIAIYLSFYTSVAIILLFFLNRDMAASLAHIAGGITGSSATAIIGFQQASARLNVLGLFLGGTLMLILGMVDDKLSISPKVKLVGQLAICAILIACGVRIEYIRNPFHTEVVYFDRWLIAAGTVFWLVGITNAINLLDGLDGLLAGVAAISSALFFLIALSQGQYLVALLLAALCGATLGFLRDNFNPARVFMGDTGSLLIGMLFASLSIMGSLKTNTTLAVLATAFVMGVPILDTSMAIVRRLLKRQHIFSADKEHLHHKLLGRGLSQRQAVLFIYAVNGLLGLTGVYFAFLHR
ncbi:MAG TPA: MraY family glycosyltransferase [Candidatus Xenobia bacterium]|jgi:UDP-GlcNAc:undecaprenyl-phosphate GlcNAc-1-phosphate transferase